VNVTASKSLSDQAIDEFVSRVSSDEEIPEALKAQLLELTNDGKWKTGASVSSALDAFYSTSGGGPNDKA
jgi:hypothetical protein